MSEERPWTAKRCTRLLRPLTTAVSSLRESRSPTFHRDRHSTSEHNAEAVPRQRPYDRMASNKHRLQNAEELDWSHFQSRKRVKRIYRSGGNRSSSSSRPEQQMNESVHLDSSRTELTGTAPSLSVKWLTEKYASIFNSQIATHGTETFCFKPPNRSRYCSKFSGKLASVMSLKRSFEAIMHETQEIRTCSDKSLPFPVTTATGVKSLFSLCLQNVSEHIKDDETWRKEQNPDDKSDALSDIYDFLESMGNGSIKGWRHLRYVVRAHAVSIVSNAVQDGIISDEEVRSLLTICADYEALEEAHRLFRTWALNPLQCHTGTRSLGDFFGVQCQFVLFYLGMTAFEYRLFNEMIEHGLLPLEWMTAPSFRRVWRSALVCVSRRQRDFREAESFLISVLHLASGAVSATGSRSLAAYQRLVVLNDKVIDQMPFEGLASEPQNLAEIRKAFTDLVSFLCAFLCAMHFVLSEVSTLQGPEIENPTYPIRKVVSQLAREVRLSDFDADKDVLVNQLLICGADMILACYELDHATIKDLEAFDQKISYLISVSKAYDELETREFAAGRILSQFVRSIAHSYGCAKDSQSTGFELLKIVVNNMLDYNGNNNEPTADIRIAFMRKLALDSVMNFTDASGTEEYEKLVLAAEESVRKLGGVKKDFNITKQTKEPSLSSFGMLQWDEGLCEWVTKTPAITSQERTGIHGGLLDFNCGSPSIIPHYSSSQSHIDETSSEIEPLKSRSRSDTYQEGLGLTIRETSREPSSPLNNEDRIFEDSGIFDSDQESYRRKLLLGRKVFATGIPNTQESVHIECASIHEDELPSTKHETSQPSDRQANSLRRKHGSLHRKTQKRSRQTDLDTLDLTSDELG